MRYNDRNSLFRQLFIISILNVTYHLWLLNVASDMWSRLVSIFLKYRGNVRCYWKTAFIFSADKYKRTNIKLWNFLTLSWKRQGKYFSRRDMIYLPLQNHWHCSIVEVISIVDILLAHNSSIMPTVYSFHVFPVVGNWKSATRATAILPLHHVFTGVIFAFGFVFAVRAQTESHLF